MIFLSPVAVTLTNGRKLLGLGTSLPIDAKNIRDFGCVFKRSGRLVRPLLTRTFQSVLEDVLSDFDCELFVKLKWPFET